MKVYTVRDYAGETTTHLAVDFKAAVQAHLIHFGLLYLKREIGVVCIKELKEVKDRSTVCWDKYCCLAGATDYGTQEKTQDNNRTHH